MFHYPSTNLTLGGGKKQITRSGMLFLREAKKKVFREDISRDQFPGEYSFAEMGILVYVLYIRI